MPEKKIRVVLGDLQKLNLDGMSAVLKSNKQLSIVATAEDAKSLAKAVKEKSPDVVVVDAQMLRRSSRAVNGESKVIQLADEHFVVTPTPSTMGVVRRTSGIRELQSAIRSVAKGDTYDLPARSRRPRLSNRERDIAELVGQGLSNRTIAETLGLSEQSVKNLVSRILRKLDLENRVQLALLQRS